VPPDIGLDEPSVKGGDEEEPEVQQEEPIVKGEGEPKVQGEDDSMNKDNETESEEQPTRTAPRKEVEGGLDIANLTQQPLYSAYKIKIIFDAIKATNVGGHTGCGNWDMGVYVQGKLVKLSNMGQPLKVCTDRVIQLKDAEATVEIPGESVESVKDYQPLSIFSAGSELDNCNPEPLPANLPEVRKVLADKGSTRPYYAHAN
jgi:hypothetical protein